MTNGEAIKVLRETPLFKYAGISEDCEQIAEAITKAIEALEREAETAPGARPKNNVDHPHHYNNGGIECIEAIKAATIGLDGFEGFCVGNSIKYDWRWKLKNGVEDIEKSVWYLQELKRYEESR